ncbi:MAG: hypothetical protein IKU26_07860 [Clostridia bacterium]|nr:hypothetical protein [Clostridia bacterium]
MRRILCIVSWLLVLCCLVGCGAPAGSDPTQAPTQLIIEVPMEDPTEESSATLEVPSPTATKTPSPTATKTPSPTTTPKPVQYVPSDVAVGDIVKFGFYEQDNNISNGQEEIEWIVLDKKDGKAFFVSKYALDCQMYNRGSTSVTWETCMLRSWLNTTFYTTAFNANHQPVIADTTLTNPDNSSYGTEGGNNTTDKIFLLSIDEVKQYFTSHSARQCMATVYAESKGAHTSGSTRISHWWLRSPGDDNNVAAFVVGGAIADLGIGVNCVNIAVRPALWINLES